MNITVKLIRHGITQPNLEGRFLGWTDAPLCDFGISGLKEMYPENISAQAVFSSPLKRCRQTAKIVFGEENPIVIDEFKEMNFGDFEMRNHAELDGNPEYQSWIDSNAEVRFPNGEQKSEFIERTMRGMRRLLDICAENNLKDVAAAVHGGTFMAVLSSISDKDYFSFMIKNGHGYELDLSYEDGNIILNDYREI